MKLIYLAIFLCGFLLCSSSMAAVTHGLSLGVIEQAHTFELSQNSLSLSTRSPKIQYQLTTGPWLLSLYASNGDNDKTDASFTDNLRYQLQFEQHSESLYLDYNAERLWLSFGYAQAKQKQSYAANESGLRSASNSEASFHSIVYSLGYGWYFTQSQLLVSSGITLQHYDEQAQLIKSSVNSQAVQSSRYETTENGWIANINISYQYYIDINDQLTWMLGSGVHYSENISGDAQISQTSRTRLSATRFITDQDQLVIDSESKSTSLSVQSGLILDNLSVNFFMEKLTTQDWDEALMEISATVYF